MRQVVGTGLLALLVLVAYGNEAGASGLTELSALTLAVGKGGEGITSFVLSGDSPRLIVIRGLGPSVTDSGKRRGHPPMIRDPRLVAALGGGTPIASNDDWRDDPNAAQIPAALQPADDKEAALARTLAPGEYVVALQESSRHAPKEGVVGIVTVSQVELAEASACPSVTPACQSIATTNSGNAVECLLSNGACGVDLNLLLQTLSGLGYQVYDNTPMWIQAWGGGGGHSTGGGSGSAGGYAQTTTSVADYTNAFGSSTLFYFVGQDGASTPQSCGAAGGSATIVTAEDLSVNPSQNPTATDVLLIAGASGGGSSSGYQVQVGNGGRGGVAIASLNTNAQGQGASSNTCPYSNQGGNGETAPPAAGNECQNYAGGPYPQNGEPGYGGLGALGGNDFGSCPPITTPTQFLNVARYFSFTAGSGGTGLYAQDCGARIIAHPARRVGEATTGTGGGGGGGFGGGGGGGGGLCRTGVPTESSIGGGGGGSFARASTQVSKFAPTSEPTEDCPNKSTVGCVQITFDLTQPSSSP
jgi:hypothetical protein